jgi:hypothetical protein
LDYQREYFEEYAHLGDVPRALREKRFRDKEKKIGMNKAFFMETKTRLHKAIQKSLGPGGVASYGILSNGRNRGFRIAVPADRIRRVGEIRLTSNRKVAESLGDQQADRNRKQLLT